MLDEIGNLAGHIRRLLGLCEEIVPIKIEKLENYLKSMLEELRV